MPDGTASLAFAGLDPDRIPGHIARRIADARQALAALLSLPAVDWATLESVLGEATDRLHRDWSVVQHLAAVNDSPALRQAIGSTQPQVVEFWTQLGASAELYRLYERLDPAMLTPEQARARTLALRGFVLSGARLDGPQRQRFAAIQARLAALSRQFSENTLDATDGWHYLACEAEVAGLPEDTRQALAEAARADGHAGQFKLSLKMPVYLAVMQFAQDRQLRARLHWANATRASDLSPPDQAGLDNTPVIGEILALRRELAGLLGFASFAELSLATKMADSPSQVQDFLHDLAARARPAALQDVAALRAFASETSGSTTPSPGTGASSPNSSSRPATASARRSSSPTSRSRPCCRASSGWQKACSASPSTPRPQRAGTRRYRTTASSRTARCWGASTWTPSCARASAAAPG